MQSCGNQMYESQVLTYCYGEVAPLGAISHYFVKYMHSSNLEYVTSMKEDNYNCKGCPI
jgi:hypothetical protein